MSAQFTQATVMGFGGIAAFILRGEPPAPMRTLLPEVFSVRPGQILHAWAHGNYGEALDEVLISRITRPGGEDFYLLTGHGGTACARALREALAAAGYREKETPEEDDARAVWDSLFVAIRTPEQLDAVAAAYAAEDRARWPELREFLRPRRICLAGAPNAGKSSLFNRLLAGEEALVSPEAGTTRDAVTRYACLGGYYCELVDTAGLRNTGAGALETEAQRRGLAELARADAVLWVMAVNEKPDAPARAAAEAIRGRGRVVLAVFNKIDALPVDAGHAEEISPEWEKLVQATAPGAHTVRISCLAETGIAQLLSALKALLDDNRSA